MKDLFWDSCVLIRYFLNDPSAPYFKDIRRYVNEAKNGRQPKWRIHFSTLTFAEIKHEHFKGEHGSIHDFIDDLGAAFSPIDPNPNILIGAGALRSSAITYPRGHEESSRVVSTPDAIILMSAVYLQAHLGVKDLTVHTLDEGKGKNWSGKCIPLIGFEKYYPPESRTETVQQVCALNKSFPSHPQPDLLDMIEETAIDPIVATSAE